MSQERGFWIHWNDTDKQKHFGSYYTPSSLAEAVVDAVVSSSKSRILEPSIGDGAFVKACLRRLWELGANGTDNQIFGTDIDPEAVERVSVKTSHAVPKVQIREADFLAVEPDPVWSAFDVILGNPPYVRHHRIQKGTVADFRRKDLGLSGGSDLWCSFALHSLKFLRPGGTLALILPASFHFAHYARFVRDTLSEHFKTAIAIRLAFKAFRAAGAEERGIVVVCAGFKEGKSSSWCTDVAWTPEQLHSQLSYFLSDKGGGLVSLIARPIPTIPTRLLGEVARISIGFVTGANTIFIISESTRNENSLPLSALLPVLSRAAQTSGIRFSAADHLDLVKTNSKVWLFSPSALGERNGPVRKYLATVPRDVRRGTLWFRKRPLWYQPLPGPRPDAVLTYMNHAGPRIILLEGAEAASNTFHTMVFDRGEDPKLVALAMLTSSAQLSAERVGRPYGGGVLKLEPSDARRIELPTLTSPPRDVHDIFDRADQLLRMGRADAACELADLLFLKPALGAMYEDTRREILKELTKLRATRLGKQSKVWQNEELP